MKERPILFSAPMVRAILEGRKTQTRRIVKPQPDGIRAKFHHFDFVGQAVFTDGSYVQCPYGKPGDRLWVRESFSRSPLGVLYRADFVKTARASRWGDRWRPSIHMPRVASRILLEITDVRVERLNEITEKDASAEGVSADVFLGDTPTAIVPFCMLWESIHGPGSWEKNPWVWVIEFKIIEP
jgi:hypothetical protein